jgi:hypothetical protein
MTLSATACALRRNATRSGLSWPWRKPARVTPMPTFGLVRRQEFAPGVGDRVDPLTVNGLARQVFLVFKQLQGRIDRAGAGPVEPRVALLQLLDQVVAVPRLFGQQLEQHILQVATTMAPARPIPTIVTKPFTPLPGRPAPPGIATTTKAKAAFMAAVIHLRLNLRPA